MSFRYFCTGLFFAFCLALSPAYGDTNLLTNPGFEDSNGWAGRGCTFTYTTDVNHSGSRSGRASGRTAAWQGLNQSMLGKMQNGNTYQISGWVRLENASTADVIVSVEQKDSAGTRYLNINSQTARNDSWIRLSGIFTLNVTGTLEVLDVYFEGPAADVNFYVDDADVSRPSVAAPAEPNTTGKSNAAIRPGRIKSPGTADVCDANRMTAPSRKEK